MDKDKLMKIFGAEELVESFEKLQFEVQNVIIRKSFKKAAKLIISEAQTNLGGRYSNVSRSLTDSYKKDIQTTSVGASRKKGGHLAYIADQGTKERFTKSGKSTGRIIPNYFFTNAISSTEGQVENIIFEDIKTNFLKMVQKNKLK